MRKVTRWISTFSVSVLLLGALAACGSDNDSTPKSVSIGMSGVKSLDPAQATSPDEILLARQLFRTLTVSDPISLEPIGDLATNFIPEGDQTSFEFVLRQDAKFSNGRTITSEDVKYSFERLAHKSTASPYADLLAPITGFASWHVDGNTGGLTGIVITSPSSLRIELDYPMSTFASVVSHPAFGVIAKEAVGSGTADDFDKSIVTSGDYTLVSRDASSSRDSSLFTLKNERSVVNGFDEVRVRRFGTQSESYEAFKKGEIKWSRVPAEQASEALKAYGDAGTRPFAATSYYVFNFKGPDFADIRFREAIVRAVDKSKFAKDDYADTAVELKSIVPQGVTGSQSDPCVELCAYNPDAARELVKQSFTLTTPKVFVDYEDDPVQARVAERIVDSLNAVGIDAKTRAHSVADYAQFVRSGQASIFHQTTVGKFPSADEFLYDEFHTGGLANFSGFSDKDGADTSLDTARSLPGAESRNDQYREAENALMSKYVVLPVVQFRYYSVLDESLEEVSPNIMGIFSFGEFKAK